MSLLQDQLPAPPDDRASLEVLQVEGDQPPYIVHAHVQLQARLCAQGPLNQINWPTKHTCNAIAAKAQEGLHRAQVPDEAPLVKEDGDPGVVQALPVPRLVGLDHGVQLCDLLHMACCAEGRPLGFHLLTGELVQALQSARVDAAHEGLGVQGLAPGRPLLAIHSKLRVLVDLAASRSNKLAAGQARDKGLKIATGLTWQLMAIGTMVISGNRLDR